MKFGEALLSLKAHCTHLAPDVTKKTLLGIKIPSRVKIVKHISACVFPEWSWDLLLPPLDGNLFSLPSFSFIFFFFKDHIFMTQDVQERDIQMDSFTS